MGLDLHKLTKSLHRLTELKMTLLNHYSAQACMISLNTYL